MRKLPIGIQDFEKIRQNDFIYADKTKYIYDLVQSGAPYFLSRPRRFGKSLLLSTMRYYLEGRRELFKGLAIETLEGDGEDTWQEYPVFYIDFNSGNYMENNELEAVIDGHLRNWEAIYGSDPANTTFALRFEYLIRTAAQKIGHKVAVLVDEYDKPLLECPSHLDEHNRGIYKGFFGVLKKNDSYLKFVFITGVTKFTKVSIFSDLNQLEDISMDREYSGICGITEREIDDCLKPDLERLAANNDMNTDDCYAELARMYDGYHFAPDSEGVYNPFSLLNAFKKSVFGSYWFESGTPTFLIERMKETGFDFKTITDGSIERSLKELMDYRTDNGDMVPLLYQSGYLTIKEYDREFDSCVLTYPNEEVRYGLVEALAPTVLYRDKGTDPLDIRSFVRDLRRANTDGIRDRFKALFAGLPYSSQADADKAYVERDFQNVIYVVFLLMGQYVTVERHTALGRADAIVECDDYVYIFEFKRDSSAEEALKQIEDMGYAKPYAADERILIKIGVNFNSEKGIIDGWEEA